jgi:hypothetical protein
MKQATLNDINADLDRYLEMADGEGIIITRGGKPAGILKGFSTEDECYDYLLQHDPELLQRLFRGAELKTE